MQLDALRNNIHNIMIINPTHIYPYKLIIVHLQFKYKECGRSEPPHRHHSINRRWTSILGILATHRCCTIEYDHTHVSISSIDIHILIHIHIISISVSMDTHYTWLLCVRLSQYPVGSYCAHIPSITSIIYIIISPCTWSEHRLS